MRRTPSASILSIGMALFLWANLAIGGQEYGGAWSRIGSGPGKGWVQFRGHVLCAKQPASTAHGSTPSRFYRLNHRLGQVVIEVTVGAEELPYHSLWMNSEDQVFETLAAEENLFKEVEVSGLLREYRPTVGILYLPTVQILG
jgi:hypothetical protein